MKLNRILMLLSITGLSYAETRVSVAGNQLSIELPAGFAKPSPEVLAKIYPDGKGPDMFRFSAINGTLIVGLATGKGSPSLLPLVKVKDEQDLARDTRPMRWIAHEITTFQGKPSLRFEYIRTTADGDMRHQMYYVLNNTNLVYFQFSVPEKQFGQYQESFQKSRDSIRLAK